MPKFSSERGGIYLNGDRFIVRGVSWFGFETSDCCLHGLWGGGLEGMDTYLSAIQAHFNVLRVPLAARLCRALDTTFPAESAISASANADLKHRPAGYVLDALVVRCASRGIYVLLDMHVNTPEDGVSELWTTPGTDEGAVVAAWEALARRYVASPNILGADLKNEPHGAATWGDGAPTDWCAAAGRMGNAVLALAPHWLIFVEGVQSYGGMVGNWGGILAGAAHAPVPLRDPSKLVYSPHCYGPGVAAGTSYGPRDWDRWFGSIQDRAVVVGEWGGRSESRDLDWMRSFADYLVARGRPDNIFWCLNPNSHDTGGILLDDWATQDTLKLDILRSIASGGPSAPCPSPVLPSQRRASNA